MKLFVAFTLALAITVPSGISFSADDHSKEKETSSGRPVEGAKKKGLTLEEKISACLAERPGKSTSTEGTAPKKEHEGASDTAPKGKDGRAIFESNCFPCHSPGGTPGKISDWSRAAVRAGDDMPPTGKVIPADELSKLKEFLSTQK